MPAALFLLAHNDNSGRPRLDTDLLNCGLLTAQLADLVLAEALNVYEHGTDVRVKLRNGRVTPPARTDAERFVVQHIGLISRMQDPTVKLLGKAIGAQMCDVVLTQLVREGILRAESTRGRSWRRQQRYRATSPAQAMYPRFALRRMLENPTLATVVGGFLVCLLDLLCAADVLSEDGITGSRLEQSAESTRPTLPPELGGLLRGTREAADAIMRRVPGSL